MDFLSPEEQEEDIESMNGISSFSNKSSILRITESEKTEDTIDIIVKEIKEDFFICKECSSTPSINFNKNDLKHLKFSCKCKKNSEKNSIKSKNINKLIVSKNDNEKNFSYYCEKCKEDLKENDDLHLDHEYMIVNYNKYITEDDINNIKEFLLDNQKNNNKNYKKMNYNGNLDKLIKIILETYEKKPNYILINNIKNILNFFKIKIYSVNDLEQYKNKIKKEEKEEKEENNEYQESTIEEIRIIFIEISNFYDLSQLNSRELKLNNLIKLYLINNNINDITPLLKINLQNLEILSFKMNKIGDNMIDCIKNLDLPNLKQFIFENNNFTNFAFFHAVEHFKKLELLDISSNPFEENVDEKLLENIYILNSIKEINLSNGIFNDNTIKLLFQFNFKNVEKILLKGNYLNINTLIKIILFLYESTMNCLFLKILDFSWNNININKLEKIESLNEEEIKRFKFVYQDNILNFKLKIDNYAQDINAFLKEILIN